MIRQWASDGWLMGDGRLLGDGSQQVTELGRCTEISG